MVKLHCGIIEILLLLVFSGQSEAERNYHDGVTVLERKVEIELTNDCGKCAFDKEFYRKCGILKTPISCYNGPGGNYCQMRRRRNLRALAESESNYNINVKPYGNRWEEMILSRENCLDVVYLNEENNDDGGVEIPVTTIEVGPYKHGLWSQRRFNVCLLGRSYPAKDGIRVSRHSTVADRETVILIACKELLDTNNTYTTYFKDTIGEEADVYVPFNHYQIITACNNIYDLVTTGDCMAPELIDNANECKSAFENIFGDVDIANVEEMDNPSYPKGCFKHSSQVEPSTDRWVFNQNGGPGTNGHCTGEAACVCRAPKWIMTYGAGAFGNMKQNSRLWKAGSKFIKQNVPLTTSRMCGLESCTEEVLDTEAGGHTCGVRIDWLMTSQGGSHSEHDACMKVANSEFPSICGGCNPKVPGGYVWNDPTFYIRRRCDDCVESHKEIIYKRLTPVPPHMDVEDLFLANWSSNNNIMGEDFNLYSSHEDAQNNVNEWQYCNYDDPGIGFPRDCGPVLQTDDQWNSLTRGGKSDVAYYVWHYNHGIEWR